MPAEPLLFFKPSSAVVGPGEAIVLPPQSRRVDSDTKLALVNGAAAGTSVRVYMLEVSCGNDVTARDLQQQDVQWTGAKGFETFCPLGPLTVTGLEERGAEDLEVSCRVNGEVRQRARASDLIFPRAELIAYTSMVTTVEPGDVIMADTPEGVGPLAAGDEVEVRVEGVGALRNPVRKV